MSKITALLKLPSVSILALSMVLTPTLSLAEKADRGGHSGSYSSHEASRAYSSKGTKHYSNDRDRHESVRIERKKHKHHRPSSHARHEYKRHSSHGHKHGHKHKHGHTHRGHSHPTYVVRDYGRDHYLSLNDLRFMFGLHTDNLDIIFHD